uniref:NADH dehydrogenase subunit 6 n=1 Tax=Beraea pullata TaxID=177796 RepID=A0A7G7CEL6_9NEOP|nr:NADH dehydrogenase subunit 6 [Beraea pullata]
MIKLFIFLLMTIMILILQINQPLIITIFMVFMNLILTMLMGIMNSSLWFSYIMFLIFISGLLILFIYISSLASNKTYQFKLNYFFINMLIIIMFFMILIFMNKSNFNYLFNLEITPMNLNMFNLNYENNLNLNKIFNKMSMIITILLMNYLLYTMIISIKIININKGPMRMK